MPAMPRPKGKGRKIAWSILGKPANLQVKKTKKEQEIQTVLRNQQNFFVK